MSAKKTAEMKNSFGKFWDIEMEKSMQRAEIEVRLEDFIDNSKPELKDRLKDKTLKDFPELEFDDYYDVLGKYESKEIQIYSRMILDYNTTLLNLIGTKEHIATHKRTQWFWAAFVILSFIGIAIWKSNYWLLLGISLFPISQFTSAKGNFIGGIIYLLALVLIVVLLFTKSYVWLALPIGFIIMHNSFNNFRDNYRRMILNGALMSEKIFLFLLYLDYITIWKTVDGKPVKVRIE